MDNDTFIIDREEAIKIIKDSKGKIFGVSFVKRSTGELRHMTARLGVRKGVTGEGLKYDPESRQLMTVYDMHKQGHRMINTETLSRLTYKQTSFIVI